MGDASNQDWLTPANRYSALVESSDDAILSKNREGIITSWNPGAERIYGYTAAEAIGRPISILIPPHRSGEELVILGDVLAGRRVDHYESERLRKDGELIYVSLTVSPVYDADGEVVEASVIARDVTERRLHEAERARLLEEHREAREASERSRRRLAFASRASELLAETLDLDTTLQQVAQLMVPTLGDWCSIDLVGEDGSFRNVAVAHTDPAKVRLAQELQDRYPVDPEAPTGVPHVVRTGKAELYPDIPDELLVQGAQDEEHLRLIRELGLVSGMTIPLSGRGRTLGAITLVAAESGRRFTPDDLDFARDLARRAAMAVDNSLLYHHEHEAAVTLQRSLLPSRLPDIPGVEFTARYMPASEGLDVGGDWYDVIALEGHVAVVIGDVAGRGLRAASVMGQLRNALRAYAIEGHSPAETVDRLDLLARNIDEPDMATVVYLDLERDTGRVRYVRAGHPPPLVRAPDGTVRRLEDKGSLPLGVAQVRHQEAEAMLGPGETLLLYTDGLVETRGRAIDEDLRRLEDVLREAPQDLDALCDHVLEQMLTESQRDDDVALLGLRPVAAPAVLRLRLPAEPEALSPLRRALGQWLSEAEANVEESFDVALASCEAAANAVEHAYGPGDAEFELEAQLDASEVEVRVRDRGRWRTPRGKNRGRGLQIMEAVMDTVEIDRGGDGTEVRMRRRLDRDGSVRR
jgi:PAS domain S-box-containing protein